MTGCVVCGDKVSAKGKCKKHYIEDWRAANPKYDAERYLLTRDDQLKRNKVWIKANPKRRLQHAAKYRAAHPLRVKAAISKWHINNPEKKRVHHQNRRARIRNAGGKLSPGISEKLFLLQRGKCACCHKSIERDRALDHVIPLAMGGKNVDENMQLLCKSCNSSKRASHPIDFMQSRGFLL